jgi:hypothetical protein
MHLVLLGFKLKNLCNSMVTVARLQSWLQHP